MKRKFLEDLGLEKDSIDKIMAENGKDIESFKSEITTLKEQITTSTATIEDLKKNNADNETLQATIKAHEDSLKVKDTEIKSMQIKNALKEAGATDIDYALFKLGEVDIKNLDNKIKEFKETNPTQFKVEEAPKGPTIVASKLPSGKIESNELQDIAEQFSKGLKGGI